MSATEPREVRRVEPKDIDPTAKEAVVDGLLNLISARISGAGRFGARLFGTKPSQQLSSGFLLPASSASEADEVSSPIRIRTHGLDFQVAANEGGRIRVTPSFAVYVRVLPTQDDLTRRDCAIQFRLRSTVSREIRRRQKELSDAWWETNRGTRRYRSEHPDWKAQQAAFRALALQESGLPPELNLREISRPADEIESDEDRAPVEDGVPAIGAVANLPDELFQPLDIPEKWLRIEIAAPSLEFDPNAGLESITVAVQRATVELNAAIRLTLERWAADPDPESGGRLWGYHPDSAEVLPSQFRSWSTHLQRIRDAAQPATLPAIDLAWDVTVGSDWLSPERRNVHIALENRSVPPRRNFWATEQAVFQVSLNVALPSQLHAPLRLGRVEPSYRYNRYLQYDALGFNSAVARLPTIGPDLALQTTWTPRYTQPRVRAVSASVNLNIAQLAEPRGLDGIQTLPDQFDAWIAATRRDLDPCAGLGAQDGPGKDR